MGKVSCSHSTIKSIIEEATEQCEVGSESFSLHEEKGRENEKLLPCYAFCSNDFIAIQCLVYTKNLTMVNEEKQKAHKAEVYCYMEAEVPRTLSNQFSYHYFQFNFPRRHSPTRSCNTCVR